MARRGGYAKGAISKELIMDRAVELFGEKGFSATSLRDIAKVSGMTHSGLLHHFPSKDALLAAVLARRDKLAFESGPLMDPTKVTSQDALDQLLAQDMQNPVMLKLHTMLAAEATNEDHPAHDYFVERYRFIHQAVTALMETTQKAGRMRADVSPDLTASMVVALLDGLRLHWLVGRGPDVAPVDMAAVMDVFMHLILADRNGNPPANPPANEG